MAIGKGMGLQFGSGSAVQVAVDAHEYGLSAGQGMQGS